MIDLLPPQLVEILRDRYRAGVAHAEYFYAENKGDEDAVTGALGQALAMRYPLVFSDGERVYQVQVSYRKVRGRGPNSPEKRFGIDGVFQMRVSDEHGEVVRQKSLPFQAKMNWRGRNRELVVQAEKMNVLQGGIIIDYTPNGYSACLSTEVVAAHGSRAQVEELGVIRPLGQVLATDFLDCTIGRVGAFYETDQALGVVPQLFGEVHMVTTLVSSIVPGSA